MTKSILLITLAALLVGCNAPIASDGKATQAAEVSTDVVKRQDLTGYSFFDGKLVIPDSAKATAYSPYDTPVVSVMTGVGKHVDRGDTLVKLTIPGADAAAQIAKENASSAKATYSAQKAGSSEPVQAAEQALSSAKLAEKAAKDTVASGGTADVEAATQTRIAAETVLRQAQEAQRQSLQPTKQAAEEASAEAGAARADAAKGLIRAPISGTILSLDAQPGMTAKSRQAVAVIVNYDAARVQGLVPPELKDLVVKGARVLIAMEGPSSKPLDGRVVDVSVVPPTQGQASPGYLAVIEFRNPEAIVLPANGVKRVGIKSGMVTNALVVPVGAITTTAGKSFVSVQSGDKWIDTPVEVGISDGALVEIKTGISEGAVIRVVSKPPDIRNL